MPSPTHPERLAKRRPYGLLLCGAAVAIGLTAFPPFHVHRLRSGDGTVRELPAGASAFDARSYAKAFWVDKLIGSSALATDVGSLYTALAHDPAAAAAQYGHRLGIGGRYYYFVRGEGRVESVDHKGVRLRIAGQPAPVTLMTGPVFGSALRDATGQADLKGLHSFDLNAFAAELNQLAETEVQPKLRQATVGMQVRFVGGATVEDTDAPPHFTVVAVAVDFST